MMKGKKKDKKTPFSDFILPIRARSFVNGIMEPGHLPTTQAYHQVVALFSTGAVMNDPNATEAMRIVEGEKVVATVRIGEPAATTTMVVLLAAATAWMSSFWPAGSSIEGRSKLSRSRSAE